MQCPKCYGDMTSISSDGENALHIDRCSKCYGLYFDQLRKSDLALIDVHGQIDTGDAVLGAEYDGMTFVDCPKCNRMMDQKSVEDPVHIRFEHCTSCYSTFLDAGELRQYLTDEFREDFKALLPS
ncbi:MAG: Zn-finger nucleic acid-binding protein [Candidatus Azotimanducaceae bacterium]|jgi:Zn-finger nucleic acid-binding protein